MISYNWQQSVGGPVMSRAQLEQAARPNTNGQNEVIPHVLFDTQSFTTAVTTQATYFQALNTSINDGNVPGPGQLPDPYFMVVQYVTCDFLIEAKAGTAAAAGPWTDIGEILLKQQAVFTVKINDKTYGQYPLRACAPLGGVIGYGVLEGATAAPGAGMFGANNGHPGSGGFFVGGAWVIEPKVGYNLTIQLAGAPTLDTSPLKISMGLVGTLYRAVR